MANEFPILNIDEITTVEEILKLKEEVEEFIEAIQNDDMDNMQEEFFDIIQVLINIMNRYNLIDDLDEGLDRHIEKIKSRKWEIKKFI